MAYSAKVGSFNIDTAVTVGNTQAVTGVGFTPKIVMFWWGGSTGTGDTVAGGTYNIGFGAMIDTTQRFCVDAISEDAQGDSDSLTDQRATSCIKCYTDTGTVDGIMDSSSLDADGFTLIVDDQFTQAYRISYLALGGTDLTNVYIGNKARDTDTGNCAVTGVGFQPDAVILASALITSASGTTNGITISAGMATGSSNQGVVSGYVQDGQAASNTTGYGYNGEALARSFTSGSTNLRDTFVSMDVDGFTLNQLENTTAITYHFIALKGGQYSVSDLTTRTDGNDIAETVGFQPVAILFMSANRALSTQDASTDHMRLSIGAGTSTTNRACAAISDEDNLADTETAYANYDTAVYANIADDAIVALMDIKSIDSSGFTCVMDDAEASACWVTYLAIGATAVAGGGKPWYAYAQQ